MNQALGYLVREADRLADRSVGIVLAGDSAGAQVALQLATLTVQPAYAEPSASRRHSRNQLVGLLLDCGLYRMEPKDVENKVLGTEFWAYSGSAISSMTASSRRRG